MKKEETSATEVTSTLEKKTLKVSTKTHLSVFSKKTLDPAQSSRMRPGAEVILDFLAATAEDGDQLVRVRKDGSTRTFYTTSKHIQEVI